MSIASEITRLQNAKADIKTAIEAKGVEIPSNATLDEYSDYVEEIPSGGQTLTIESGTSSVGGFNKVIENIPVCIISFIWSSNLFISPSGVFPFKLSEERYLFAAILSASATVLGKSGKFPDCSFSNAICVTLAKLSDVNLSVNIL